MAGSKIPRSSLVIYLRAGHAQLNRKSAISFFKSDISRVGRFTTAGQEERRAWVRGWEWTSKKIQISAYTSRQIKILYIFVHKLHPRTQGLRFSWPAVVKRATLEISDLKSGNRGLGGERVKCFLPFTQPLSSIKTSL